MEILRLLIQLITQKSNIKKTKADINRLQSKKLTEILLHAYNNSPYYREVFEKAGIGKKEIGSHPLSAYPSLDKSTLINEFDRIVTDTSLKQEEIRKFDEISEDKKLYLDQYHLVHSSGSTGNPCFFVYDKMAWNQMLIGIIRGALWDMSPMQMLKLVVNSPRILYIAATDGRYGGAMAVSDGITGIHAKQMSLDIKTPLSKWRKKVEEFAPTIIIGYPSAIKILGEELRGSSVLENVTRVISCGEPLGTNLRAYLEKTYGCIVINFYGASESLAIGVETDGKEGMYLFDDLNYIEVINGQMYLTCLYNFTQPIIRYRLSDRLNIIENTSDRGFSKTQIPHGRKEDILWFEDGKGGREFIHPLDLEGICIEGLLDYQFIQSGSHSFQMHAQINEDGKKEQIYMKIMEVVQNILEKKGLENVDFEVDFVGQIMPDNKTGKKRLVVRTEGDIL